MKRQKFRHKRGFYLILGIVIFALVLSGCEAAQPVVKEKEKIVKVHEVIEENYPSIIYYYGYVVPDEIRKYSFKTGGKIQTINVAIGDSVLPSDLLATLDAFEYNLSYSAALDQLKLAKLDESKAQDASDYYEKVYSDMQALFAENVISKNQLDEIALQRDIKVTELEQAQKVKQQAEIDLSYKSKTVEDTGLVNDIDGYVLDILFEEGELIGQGYPAVIVRSKAQIVKISVSINDVKKLKLKDEATVAIDKVDYRGEISHINMVPDPASQTFEVEITLIEDELFTLGEVSHVYITQGDLSGIWLDINHVMNDGKDYVYTVYSGRAIRKDIQTHDVYKDKVRVTGLSIGDLVITEGNNALVEGYKVTTQGDEDE